MSVAPGPFATEPPASARRPATQLRRPAEGGTFVEWSSVIERLTTAEAYWIGTVMPGSRPHVVPVWGTLFEGDLFLETGSPLTRKNRNLAENRNVVVHLDGINDALIVRGVAERIPPDPEFRKRLAAAMKAKYGGQYSEYEPEPDRWDLGQRVAHRAGVRPRLARHAHGDAVEVRSPELGHSGAPPAGAGTTLIEPGQAWNTPRCPCRRPSG